MFCCPPCMFICLACVRIVGTVAACCGCVHSCRLPSSDRPFATAIRLPSTEEAAATTEAWRDQVAAAVRVAKLITAQKYGVNEIRSTVQMDRWVAVATFSTCCFSDLLWGTKRCFENLFFSTPGMHQWW